MHLKSGCIIFSFCLEFLEQTVWYADRDASLTTVSLPSTYSHSTGADVSLPRSSGRDDLSPARRPCLFVAPCRRRLYVWPDYRRAVVGAARGRTAPVVVISTHRRPRLASCSPGKQQVSGAVSWASGVHTASFCCHHRRHGRLFRPSDLRTAVGSRRLAPNGAGQ